MPSWKFIIKYLIDKFYNNNYDSYNEWYNEWNKLMLYGCVYVFRKERN